MIKISSALLAISVSLSTISTLADTKDDRDDDSTQVAKAWFNSLMTGETAVTTSLSAVPFAFDSKKEVEKLSELKKLYDTIIKIKGKRNLKVTSHKIEASSAERVQVALMIEDEKVLVTVKPGDAFRVIGFRD